MPYIKVNVDKINDYQQKAQNIQKKIDRIYDSFYDIRRELDYDVKGRDGINSSLNSITSSLSYYDRYLRRISTFLCDSLRKYSNIDDTCECKDNQSQNSDYSSLIRTYDPLFPYIKVDNSNSVSVVGPGDIIKSVAEKYNVSEDAIIKGLKDSNSIISEKAEKKQDILSDCSNCLTAIKVVRELITSTDFTLKNGYVIVSDFTRDSLFNKAVQLVNDGTGIGTRYKLDTLTDTPVIGSLYKFDKVVDAVDDAVTTLTAVAYGVEDVADATTKVLDIWDNDELTHKEKVIDTAAVAITSTIGTAIDVAAPFVAGSVQTAVTTAMSAIPGVGTVVGMGVGWVAGQVVENGMHLVSDVITSEEVVNQVADSLENVGDAVDSGIATVSNATKKLLESKNTGEAIVNAAGLVGDAFAAGTKVVATTLVETTKTVTKVAIETAKATTEAVSEKVTEIIDKVNEISDKAVGVVNNVSNKALSAIDTISQKVAGKSAVIDGTLAIASEAIVASNKIANQVVDSAKNIGDAVSSGVSSVSKATVKVLESQNAKELVSNTAKLVGTSVVAGTKVVATTVAEGAKTAAKTVVESTKVAAKTVATTAKTAVKTVAKTAQKAASTVKKLLKKW